MKVFEVTKRLSWEMPLPVAAFSSLKAAELYMSHAADDDPYYVYDIRVINVYTEFLIDQIKAEDAQKHQFYNNCNPLLETAMETAFFNAN